MRYTRRFSRHPNFTAFLLVLFLGPLLYWWEGFVLKTIWNWFAPMIFMGAPILHIVPAIGVALFGTALTFQYKRSEDEGVLEEVVEYLASAAFIHAYVLVIGFIVHGL